MRTASRKSPSHELVRRKLMERMEALTAAGESRLPGLRDLAQSLDTSLVTVNRVVRRLALEGKIVIIPRQGNFIAKAERCPNIGIIMVDSDDFTFVRSARALAGALSRIEKRNGMARIIEATSPTRALALLPAYKLDGCIWHSPAPEIFDKVDAAQKSLALPSIALYDFWRPADNVAFASPHASPDFMRCNYVRAGFLASRGHRKIARFNFIGREGDKDKSGLPEVLAKIGAEWRPEWNVRIEEAATRIPALLDQGEITAAVVNGGKTEMRTVFEILSAHPAGARFELAVDGVMDKMRPFVEEFPRVKVAGVHSYPKEILGETAANALLDRLESGKPLKSVFIPTVMTDLDGEPLKKTEAPA